MPSVNLYCEDESGGIHPTRLCIKDASGYCIIPEQAFEWSNHRLETRKEVCLSYTRGSHEADRHFYSNGKSCFNLPPGDYTFQAWRSSSCSEPVRVLVGEIPQDIRLKTATRHDLHKQGWRSADLHLHLPRGKEEDEQLLTLLNAENLDFGFTLHFVEFGSSREVLSRGDFSKPQVEKNGSRIVQGEEFRCNEKGHLVFPLLTELIEPVTVDTETPLLPFISIARQDKCPVIIAHSLYGREALVDVFAGECRLVEIIQWNQFAAPELWYDVLNCGIPVFLAAGTDFPLRGLPGSDRVYALPDDPDCPRSFLKALGEGKAFATTGPLIFLRSGTKNTGDTIRARAGETVEFEISVESDYPIGQIELLQNGTVMEQIRTSEKKFKSSFQFKAKKSSWFAVRVDDKGKAPLRQIAHTNPLFVSVGGKPVFDPESALRCRERIQGSMLALKELVDIGIDSHPFFFPYRDSIEGLDLLYEEFSKGAL